MVALRTASSAALLAAWATRAAGVTCFTDGQQYVEQGKTDRVPNAGYFHAASYCQRSCQANPFCTRFMWKERGNFYQLIGNGGCWALSNAATLEPVNASETPGQVVTGPQSCPDSLEVPPNSTSGNATAAPSPSIFPTLPPMPTLFPPANTTVAAVTLPAVVATGAPTVTGSNVTAGATNASIVDGMNITGTMGEKGNEGGGGFPWWGTLLIVLGVVGIAGALMYFVCGDEGKAPKKKKKVKRSAKAQEPIPEVEAPLEAAPLVEMAAPEPVTTAAPPVPTFAPQAVAYMQPQVLYAQQPGAYTMARQPQFVA